MTKLLIARHGNTFAPSDIVRRVGTTDLPLVESGLLQGKKLGLYLQENNLIPDIIFTSNLKRTIQTTEQAQLAMGTTIPTEALSLFNEIDYGVDENQPEETVLTRVGAQALKEWEERAKVPIGWRVEPELIIKQWHNFAKDIARNYSGKTILVVTSNGIARFAPYLTGDFDEFWKNYPIKISTGALCILEKDSIGDNWHCVRWNVRP